MDGSEPIAAAPVPRELDSGLRALCGIAAFYRIAADPQQLQHDLALTGRLAGERHLLRAARMIGLKARAVTRLSAKRLRSLPVPAIVQVRDGSYHVLGGINPSGKYRLVDPIGDVTLTRGWRNEAKLAL